MIKKRNRIFRLITLGIYVIAMAMCFIPPLVQGGRVGVFWLVSVVIQTVMFCAVFFRDARRRTVASVFLTLPVIFWSLIVFALGTLITTSLMEISVLSPIIVYSVCSIIAAVFALAGPRRYYPIRYQSYPESPPPVHEYNQQNEGVTENV